MGKKKKSKQKEIVAPRPLFQIPIPLLSIPLGLGPIRPILIPVPPTPRDDIRKGINMANLTTVMDVKFSKKEYVQQLGMNTQHTQAEEQYVQYPAANIYINQPEVQSTYQMTPVEEMRYPGRDIQQLPSQLYSTPFLQSSVPSQYWSNTVASTSVGAESAIPRRELIEVDLTKKVIEVDLTKDETDVDLSNEETDEVESMNDVIEVDRWNVARLLDAQPDIVSDTSPDIWHKVIVTSDLVDRVAVLNAINRRISPLKLTPYFFRMEDGHITFLVNNCTAPLQTLFKRKLLFHNICTPIHLKVQLRAKKVNLDAILQRVIRKRLSAAQRFLDLSDLTSIPEIQQMMYDPSDTSHLQQQLLRLALERGASLISLSLAGNGISTLRHLTGALANQVKWWDLKVLDLSDNKITSIREVVVFKSVHINPTELYLHNNPVCGIFRDNLTYTRNVRIHFPSLIKLDGVYLRCTPGLPQPRPNYILCSSHGDPAELADQFLEHFFTLYDGEDRALLRALYHEDAYFSVSSNYLPGQSTSPYARLTSYVVQSRDLLDSSNRRRTKSALCKGPEKILAKLEKLPRTRHDPYSFSVDLLHHSDTSTILTVTGVFEEQNKIQKISPRHFMRTFVLVRLANDEYQIVNDIMYVTNTTTAEAKVAFRYMRPRKNLKKIQQPILTEREKNSMTERYSQLTNMRPEWSRKCLDTVGWDLREALETFIEMYKADKIPACGFK